MGYFSFQKGAGRWLAALLTVLCLLISGVQPVFAASSSTYINSITINLDLSLAVGESLPSLDYGYGNDSDYEIYIPSNDKYEIKSAKWSSSASEVKLGGTYSIKVTLEAINDYKFSGSYSSSKVKVKGGEYVSAQRSGSGRLVVTVKTKAAKGTLSAPDDACWQSSDSNDAKFGYAKWDSVDDAAYDVVLYRGSKLVYKVEDLHSTSYNFYPYMTAKGTYTFKVRSIPTSDDVAKYASRSEYLVSDELYVDEDEVSDGSGQSSGGSSSGVYTSAPETSQVGWIASGTKYFFRYPDGEYVKNGWAYIADTWYLFDASGAMLTGWQLKDNVYYYLGTDGKMRTGWYLENNTTWYYLYDSGAMATGWLHLGDKTYYLTDSGAMAVGWQVIDGNSYYFYSDGHMAVNETVDGLFRVDQNGVWKR